MSARRRTPRPSRRASRAPTIVWSARALADLEDIGSYIARDDPVAAERWVTKLIAAAERAASAPMAGRRVPELRRDDVREALLGNYRIVYRIAAERFEVVVVFEGHRLFPRDAEPLP